MAEEVVIPENNNIKNYFKWTDKAKLLLAREVMKNGAYKKSSINMTTKWQIVLSNLIGKEEFSGLEITPLALQNKFNSEQKLILETHGISKEGANLSGLDEIPSDYVSLMIDMAETKSKEKNKKDKDKLKKKLKDQAMKNTENSELKKQGRQAATPTTTITTTLPASTTTTSATDNNNDSSNNPSTVSSSTSSNQSTVKSNHKISYLEALNQKLIDALGSESTIDAEDLELDRKLKRAQILAAENQANYYASLMNNNNK